MNEIEVDPQPLPPREVIEYFEIPLRRPWLTLVPLLVFSLGAYLMYHMTPKWYESTTLILVESEKVPELLTKTVLEKSGDRLKVVKQEMLSRTRLERIVRELDPYPEYTGKRATSEVVEYMRGLIAIAVKGNDAFTITYVNKNAYLAMAVTNRLATLFIEEAGQTRSQQLSTASKFIQNQLDEARQSLESKERQVRALKEKYMGALPEEQPANIGALQRLQAEKQTLSTNITMAESRRIELERNYNEELTKAPGSVATTSTSQAALEKSRADLAELRLRYTEQHPEVKRLQARISRLEQLIAAEAQPGRAAAQEPQLSQVARNLRDQIQEVKLDLLAWKTRVEEIDRRVVELEQRVALTPHAEAELLDLNRDYYKLKENYDRMLNKRLEAEMAENLEKQWKGQRYRMLDPAYLPDKAYSPQVGKYLGIGIGLGLFLGLGAAIAAELLDHSIKNAREIEVVLPHPLLVTVPHMAKRRIRARAIADSRA